MNQKVLLTKYVLEQLGQDASVKSIRKILPIWWQNPRIKDQGGLGLTLYGYEAFKKADIEDYTIFLNDYILLVNKYIIWIDQYVDCPFYLEDNQIHLFGQRMAVQISLLSGNILQYSRSKAQRDRST